MLFGRFGLNPLSGGPRYVVPYDAARAGAPAGVRHAKACDAPP